jgi:hypothetical protein
MVMITDFRVKSGRERKRIPVRMVRSPLIKAFWGLG